MTTKHERAVELDAMSKAALIDLLLQTNRANGRGSATRSALATWDKDELIGEILVGETFDKEATR